MLAEQVIEQTFCYADEFDYGLELVLDGLEKRLGRSDGWGRASTPVPQADRLTRRKRVSWHALWAVRS